MKLQIDIHNKLVRYSDCNYYDAKDVCKNIIPLLWLNVEYKEGLDFKMWSKPLICGKYDFYHTGKSSVFFPDSDKCILRTFYNYNYYNIIIEG